MAGVNIYEAYHDTEWGVPERDSRALWEKLVLGRVPGGPELDHYPQEARGLPRRLHNFDPEKVARYGGADRARLMADPGIIRSNAKIDAAISGARIYLDMQQRGEDLADMLWAFTDGKPLQPAFEHQVPAQTPLAVEMAKALKAKGFKFCGPVIVYAFMQAVGITNDHLTGCFRHDPVRRMGEG